MRQLEIYRGGVLAGLLTEIDRKNYSFHYTDAYYADPSLQAVSLTLPKNKQEYHSVHMFPFFSNLLAEGVNRKLQSVTLKIDEEDDFSLLEATARHDTIGAITVKPVIKS